MWHIWIIFTLVAVSAYPQTDQEYKQEMTKYVMKCSKEHPVEMSELFNLEKLITPKNKDTKCLLACAYRMEGSMTKDGLYNFEYAKKLAAAMQDEGRKEKILKLGEICKKVNDKSVSDGEKGCDRAGQIFKCVIENAPKLGFKV